MIQSIQKSKTFRVTCVFMAFNIFAQVLFPMQSWALTGGPQDPNFSGFTPVGTSDMVDLSSGDMNYNIPLMDVGGYPINIAYTSNTTMDDESGAVGLNWNLSVGQINRNVRGIPDDFKGDAMTYENYMQPNVTVGADLKVTPALFGGDFPVELSAGVSVIYNNYVGYTVKKSMGMQLELGKNASVGFNAETSKEGMSISPSLSVHEKNNACKTRGHELGLNVGCSFNTRQGLTGMSLSMSNKTMQKIERGKNKGKQGSFSGSVGSSIGFVPNTYTPTKRVGMNTEAFTVAVALGSEIFGGELQGNITGYGTIQSIWPSEQNKQTAAYGYENTHLAGQNSDVVLDFNREKDGSVLKVSKNLALTNYTYDIYSVQGQGVSGMFRPYRGQIGYVYDPYISDFSVSGTLGLEFGVGNLAHGGASVDATMIDSHTSGWKNDNNAIGNLTSAAALPNNTSLYEEVYFKNVGDRSVDPEVDESSSSLLNKTGGYQPVRFKYQIGAKFFNTLQSTLAQKTPGLSYSEADVVINSSLKRNARAKRNQAIQTLTIGDLKNKIGYGPWAISPSSISPYAKDHHTGEIQITRNDGAKYVYGVPLYNTKKVETTFAVDGVSSTSQVDRSKGTLTYSKIISPKDQLPNDQFYERTTTPAYAHTYLLSNVLSADYQDVDNNGPSENDLGDYKLFEYTTPSAINTTRSNIYKWRIPCEPNKASYDEGLNTDQRDDRGNYVYGEKEIKLLKTIKTKTHVAIFTYSDRKDGLGVSGEEGGIDASQVSYKLDKIDLFSVADYTQNGNNAIPIKTANFVYSYSLCPGVPNNSNGAVTNELSNKGGKLTLKKIYFTYKNSKMGKYTAYKFNYNEFQGGLDEFTTPVSSLVINSSENPSYNLKGYDSWANYLPNSTSGSKMTTTAPEFPFTIQDNKATQDVQAAVWNLKHINLPSGGSIDVDYESDDYASVQNRDVMGMFKIAAVGGDFTPSSSDLKDVNNKLYSNNNNYSVNQYIYVKLPSNTPSTVTAADYLKNINQLYFRMFTNMTANGGNATITESKMGEFDYVTGYLSGIDPSTASIKTVSTTEKYLQIKLPNATLKDGGNDAVNPISKAGWHFARKYLGRYAYATPGDDPNAKNRDIEEIAKGLVKSDKFSNLIEIFKGPNAALRRKLIAQTIVKEKSWIRLNIPSKRKLGGGLRVLNVKTNDVWQKMTSTDGVTNNASYQAMTYGQNYSYTLKDGVSSSGVASYEPVGNKENPFVQPVVTEVKHLLGPDDESYIEEPFGESFFPNPQVTYSRICVSSLQAGQAPAGKTLKKLHKTGKIVHEFYTTKDFPTIVDQAKIDSKVKKDNLLKLLHLSSNQGFVGSQGYSIHLNDMNGKEKAEWVYAEGQTEPISGVEHKYSMQDPKAADYNKGRLNNIVKVINPDGTIASKRMGVEVDVVNDFRESISSTTTNGVNGNLASFLLVFFPGIVPTAFPTISTSSDILRLASTTKVINTFGIEEETIVYTDGSKVSTKNLAWDAVTGEVLLTQTVDEFDQQYYTLNYPAHWYYKGMGQAVDNLGFQGKFINSVNNYSITGVNDLSSIFIEGDELVVKNNIRAWVSKVQPTYIQLMKSDGSLFTNTDNITSFEVYRSGHRNLQSAGIMNVTLMTNPLKNTNGTNATSLSTTISTTTPSIINAGAVVYSNNWPAGCECGVNASGVYNPYRVNEKGIFRTVGSYTYLTGRTFSATPTPKADGFFNSFSPMYQWNPSMTMNTNGWTSVSTISKFNPVGVEVENKDALNRYSAAQYGYNNKFPIAVGANTTYNEIGFNGFEDYTFGACGSGTSHFKMEVPVENGSNQTVNRVTTKAAHTGKNSILVRPGLPVGITSKIPSTSCPGILITPIPHGEQ